MKKVTLIIIAICCLLLSYYSGKQVAYHENEEVIQDLYELYSHSDELLDMYYDHDPDYYLDSISNTESFQKYQNLSNKLLVPF